MCVTVGSESIKISKEVESFFQISIHSKISIQNIHSEKTRRNQKRDVEKRGAHNAPPNTAPWAINRSKQGSFE